MLAPRVLLLACMLVLAAHASSAPARTSNLLLFPSSECGSQAEMLTIGVQLLKRGHRVSALVADGCEEEARAFLLRDSFLDPLPDLNAADSSSSSDSKASGETVEPSTSTGADTCSGGANGEGGEGSEGMCTSPPAGEGSEESSTEGDGQPKEQQTEQKTLSEQSEQTKEQAEQSQKQREARVQELREEQRTELLRAFTLLTYKSDLSLEDFVSTKIMVSDQKARVSLAHRTDFALANCGQLLANTSLMTGLKSVGFDAVMGDLSDACAWPLTDALSVDARIDVDASGSPAPPYLAYGMRYPLAYVPAEGSGLAGGQLTLKEKAYNLVQHLKLAWEKRTVLKPKVHAFRQRYAELHPGLLRGKHTQQAQQAARVQQAQQAQQAADAQIGSAATPPSDQAPSSRQQQQRQTLENELNAIKDVRLNTLLCIVTSDWAFQEPYALPPLVRHVGPVLPGPVQTLPASLQKFIEAKGRRSGSHQPGAADPPPPPVIVVGGFSTGGYKLSRPAMVGLAEAFSELNLVRVVWQLSEAEQEKLAGWYKPVLVARHVHITAHLPLNDLLAHPTVRAFMCDGSLASVYHALWHGVPMLMVPMTVEQESNVARALRLGVARRLQRSHLEQGFGFMVEHALGRVSSGAAYRIRAAKLSRRMRAANPTPAATAAVAIEAALGAGTSIASNH